MENIREHVYLAALLHDIGKFYQRASDQMRQDGSNLSEISKNLADTICPLNQKGNFGYQHCVWTAEFLEKHKDIFKKALGIANEREQEYETSLVHLSAYHHRPDSELSALISLADWWSAGMDRFVPKDESDERADDKIEVKWGASRYKKIPLFSIFNSIEKGENTNKTDFNSAFPLTSLDVTEKIFPKKINSEKDGENQEKYKTLWDEFEAELKNLPTDSFSGFSESLLFLLKKYTWCIPSSTVDMANVSLFEHLKTTAAFADCLYLYKTENPKDFVFDTTTKRIRIREDVFPVILLGADLSGIQKFIYNIASQKAAVSLKGRSFYLQLLVDSVIQRIISDERIDVNLGNVVYASGGKFYMLLPNTEKVRDAIAQLRNELEQELFEDWKGQLAMNLDYVPFAYSSKGEVLIPSNDCPTQIGVLWDALAEKLSGQKNQKFRSGIEQGFDTMFNPIDFEEEVRVCAVTGIESVDCVKIDDKKNDEDAVWVLRKVREQVKLGNVLKDADYIITYKGDGNNEYLNNRSKFNINIFKVSSYLFDQTELTKDDADFRGITSADVSKVFIVNETKHLSAQLKGQKISYGFQFYGGNKQALKWVVDDKDNTKGSWENKDFRDLVRVEKNGKFENTYLGILRMDVDDLGSIFINGLPKGQRSFSAYATLSFLLDWFFSGYLNTIRNSDNFKNDVNILYSGGDDVFAVGRWDKLIEFAHEIRKEFGKFVGRDDISISGGIAMVGEKFPISKAAELAGEAEHNAKQFDGKNAFNLFGQTISWKEYDFVKEWKDKFVKYQEAMPRSILHKIMAFAELKNDYERYRELEKESQKRTLSISEIKEMERKRHGIKYVWHTVYYLKRFKEGKKDDVKNLCDELQNEVLSNPRKYDLMAVAARWAELLLKEFANKD